MPEFHLDHGSDEGSRNLSNVDEFTCGYIEAMFFTETSDAADEHADATVADISDDGWAEIIKDCSQFQLENEELLETVYDGSKYDAEQAGRDFWLTRNGHGAGFWDRGLEESAAQALSNAARGFGEAYIDNVLGASAPAPKI